MERSAMKASPPPSAGARHSGDRSAQTDRHEIHEIEIDVQEDGFVVDAALLAELFDLPPSEVQHLMHEGHITSVCEKGLDEHRGQFRLTFSHGNRRARISVDPSGRVLGRSVINFGKTPSPPTARPSGI